MIMEAPRCNGTNLSVPFSRNGEVLSVAATAKGKVLSVRGSVIDVAFARELPGLHEALIVRNRSEALVLEVEQLLSRGIVRTIALGNPEGLSRGLIVERTGQVVRVPVGPATLGRVFNVLGESLDGLPPIFAAERWPIHRPVPSFAIVRRTPKFLETGIKVIDLLAPLSRAGTAGIIGGAGVGKTILLQEVMRTMSGQRDAVVVFAGVGERTREGNDLWLEMRESGALARSVMVFGQMSESPGVRFRVVLTALTMAEYFRDREQKEVIFLVDNVLRYLQAGGEVSGLLGRMPAEMGYQPTLASDLAVLEARISAGCWAGITSVQAIYVPADDLTDPAVAHTFLHIDSSILLMRDRAAQGLYPAVDALASTSRLLDPAFLGERHYQLAMRVKQTFERYREVRETISILGMEELRPEDQQTVRRARRLERFLTQPLFTTESFTGQPGVYVALEDTLAGCEAILAGEFDEVDERRLYMIGAAREVGGRNRNRGRESHPPIPLPLLISRHGRIASCSRAKRSMELTAEPHRSRGPTHP
jgi:F-type H+-transporting ATPase subunit beta